MYGKMNSNQRDNGNNNNSIVNNNTSRGLELGMSGMSLTPSFGGGSPSGSEGGASSSQHGGGGRYSHDSLDIVGAQQHTSPPSPQHNHIMLQGQSSPFSSKGLSRPPGLSLGGGGGPAPLPFGKPDPGHGHSKQSSASSAQSLTLTPASSLDGNSDLYSAAGISQSSPLSRPENYSLGPSSSGGGGGGADEHSDLPRGITTFGGFDDAEEDDDGLLGLEALRDRAHSSPGPHAPFDASSSSARGGGGMNQNNHNQQRPRAVSRDGGRGSRPPLSGGAAAAAPHTENNNASAGAGGGGLASFSNNRNSREPSPPPSNNYAQELLLGGPGVISRPDIRFLEPLPDPRETSLRRSVSVPEYVPQQQNSYNMYQNNERNQQHQQHSSSSIDQQQQQLLAHNNKFGSSLSSSQGSHNMNQQQQQRMQHPHQQQQQQQAYSSEQHARVHEMQRHQRSLSQPGPARQEHYSMPDEMHHRRSSDYGAGISSSSRLPPGMENNDYGSDMRYSNSPHPSQHTTSSSHHSQSISSGDIMDQGHYAYGRSNSMGTGMPNSVGGPMDDRGGGQASNNNMHRRSSLQTTGTPSSGILDDRGGGQATNHLHRRSSLPTAPNGTNNYYNSGGGPSLQRRDAPEFIPGQSGRYNNDGSVPVVASNEEMRMFSNNNLDQDRMGGGGSNFNRHERLVSPGHSPLHQTYGSHSRNPSDMGSSVGMGHSPMSLGSGGMVSSTSCRVVVLS
jgi:hypothetical protein